MLLPFTPKVQAAKGRREGAPVITKTDSAIEVAAVAAVDANDDDDDDGVRSSRSHPLDVC